MDSICKMTPWLVTVFCLITAGCTNPMDQQTSETSHDQQVAILKQIRKVNDDGSYTFGYEAGDGSFKVESRDVLGNIKGTFGFVDAEGEIKRVSYSSANGTGFRSTTVPPLQEQISVVQSIQKSDNASSSTTRKPSVVYATEASARSSVVQTIPRHRKTTTTSTTTTTTTSSTTSAPSTPTKPASYYGHYAKASPSRIRQRLGVQHRAPVVVEESVVEADEDSQITRPSISEEKESPAVRRVVYAKRPVASNQELRPITEEFDDREEDVKITTGNTLRRQLTEVSTKSDGDSETVDENADVYGGALTVSRPLFTTSTPPRVVQRLNGPRVERPKTIYVNQNNVGPAKFEQEQKLEAQEAYDDEAKVSNEEIIAQQQQQQRQEQQQVLFRIPHRAQAIAQASQDYARQNSAPVYARDDPTEAQFLGQVPPEGIIVEARRSGNDENDDDPGASFRPVPLGRIIFRPLPSNHPLYQTPSEPSQPRYLGESSPPEQFTPIRSRLNGNFLRAHTRPAQQPRPLPYPEDEPEPITDPESQDFPSTQDYYRSSSSNLALPPPPHLPLESSNPINPPLSRRDFQILLRRLLISQYGPRALVYPRTYLEDALYDQQPYPSYQSEYQAPPRPLPIHYGERLAVQPTHSRRPAVSRALNPIYQPNRYEDYQDTNPGYAKRVYRQKFYSQEPSELDNEEVLPPAVREALLVRMLHLAINPNRSMMPASAAVMAKTNPTSSSYRYRKIGPVRNVQIITDEDDDEGKDIVRGKGV